MRQALLYYLELLVVPWGSTCRCSHICHTCSGMLRQWLLVILPNRAGCQDVGCPRRFEWGQVIDPVVEGGNFAQLVNVFQKRKDMKTSVVKLYQVFLSCGFDSHLRYSSIVSISLKLSRGWHPTAITRWNVCTMLVFTWECSVDLQSH